MNRYTRRTVLRAGLWGGTIVAATTSCTPSAPSNGTPPAPSTGSAEPLDTDTQNDGPESSRVLLAFFSRAGENYYYGDRTFLEVGNTQVVAEMIDSLAAVDVYQIEDADPYPDDYDTTVERNRQEQNDDARPEIAAPLPDPSQYDVLLLGSPVWNVRPPMIMRTFLDSLDMTGKTVHPFVTYGVSGMGRVADEYIEALPGSTVTEGLAIQGETAEQAQPEVRDWLQDLELLGNN